MRVPDKKWAAKPEYQSLLYFCQMLDDMVWDFTRDSHRAPAMNTYHLCMEVQRTWDETQASSLREGLISTILDELHATGSGDPTVIAHFSEPWCKLAFALKFSVAQDIKVGAVARFFHQIEHSYLKRCRDEIQKLISGRPTQKEKMAILTGAFCSYLQNTGYTPRHISRVIYLRFFNRELVSKPVRELQAFFALFSSRPIEFDIYMSVTEQLAAAASDRDFVDYNGRLPLITRDIAAFKSTNEDPKKIVLFHSIRALDEFGAVEQAEAKMALVRAVAYTARADVDLAWHDEAVVTSPTNKRGYLVRARDEQLRKRYRDSASYQFQVVGKAKRAVLEDQLPSPDANRLKNALLSYANAFHSESRATQLVTLWSALEGLLPASNSEGRIDTVVRYSLACQRNLYLRNLFRWSFIEHLAMGREPFFKLLNKASDYTENLSRFVALLCFPKDESLSIELGALVAKSPLTTQRGFALYNASKNVRDLQRVVDAHVQRVGWQLRRIYRERNRIVHRADPSPNVGTLILNLNEYLVTVFEVLFTADVTRPYELGLDRLFEAILLDEEFRSKKAAELLKKPLSAQNSMTVLGFALQ
ncbi:hypothetical protein [Komagataeibacter diospyri]|uniref:hypothetical protein n=1 Tax=Komagataeibacter diospyri TaxID=1932662 RepID=UPI0037562F18